MIGKRESKVSDEKIKEHCLINYPNITPERARFYQDKLRHYLKSYRQRNKLSTEEMAQHLGYKSREHYKMYEQVLPNNRVIKAIDLFSFLGSIEKMDEYNFFTYLFDPPLSKREEQLQPWESRLLKAMNNIDLLTRRNFTNSIIDPNSEAKQKKLERIISIALNLNQIRDADLDAIEQICNSLVENK